MLMSRFAETVGEDAALAWLEGLGYNGGHNGGQALIICLFEPRHPSRSRLMGDPAKYVKLLQIAFPTPPGDPAVLSVS